MTTCVTTFATCGIDADEGSFHSTNSNHKSKLDPALIRPGRADVIVEFKNATKGICRDMFKVFYPVTGKYPVRYARPSDVPLPNITLNEKSQTCISKDAIESLADAFAVAIPDGEFSPAQIQGELPGEAFR